MCWGVTGALLFSSSELNAHAHKNAYVGVRGEYFPNRIENPLGFGEKQEVLGSFLVRESGSDVRTRQQEG